MYRPCQRACRWLRRLRERNGGEEGAGESPRQRERERNGGLGAVEARPAKSCESWQLSWYANWPPLENPPTKTLQARSARA